MNDAIWLKHRDILDRLRVDPKTLRARMAQNPPHIDPPWINVGSDRRPDYRWRADAVDPWWVAIHRWRTDATATGTSQAPRSRSSAAEPGDLSALVRSRLKTAA